MRKLLLTTKQIQDILDEHKHNIDTIFKYNKRLRTLTDKKSWLATYNERAKVLRDIFLSNEARNIEIEKVVNSTAGFHYEQTEALYHVLMSDFDRSKYDDTFFHIAPLEMLTRYYTVNGDLQRQIPLLCRLGSAYISTVRQQCYENVKAAQRCFETVLDARDKYNLIPDMNVRCCFFTAYYSIIYEMTELGRYSIDINKSAKYMKDMISFYESPIVQKLDGASPQISEIVELTKRKWLEREDVIDRAQPSTRQLFIDISSDMYFKALAETKGTLSKVSAEIVLAYIHSRILDGEYTYFVAIQGAMEYYNERRKNTEPAEDTFFFETKYSYNLITSWLTSKDIPADMRDRYRQILIEDRCRNFPKLAALEAGSASFNYSVYSQCCHTIGFMENQEDKEIALMSLLINRHPPTFFHTCMVVKLASVIAEAIFRNNPGIFVNTLNLTTTEEILNNKNRIMEYIRRSALFHDIGKIAIFRIISTGFRQLTSAERKVLQLHPALGCEELDDDLYGYHDIIIGHHRSYDMAGGYPLEYDPEESPVKVICDLISICDALDAATDYLDRPYAQRKTYAAVLIELMKGSGTKYNPDIVMLLRNDEHLYGAINDLLSNRREDLYYEWFSRYFN